MKQERSVGAVIYSPERRKFLLLKHRDGHWEFPKGKVEPGETAEETRDREIEEETGIVASACLDFQYTTRYEFYHRGRISKEVEYGLLLSDDQVRISDEHRGYRWEAYPRARAILKYPEHRKLLRAAAKRLVRSGRIIPGFSL